MIHSHEVYYPLYNDKEKFIILITGGRSSGKCLKEGTPIMMADLTIKNIEDIHVGDKVMGDDGTPRNVMETHNGFGDLYRVKQQCGIDYSVNENHILTVFRMFHRKTIEDIMDMPLQTYLKKRNKSKYYGLRTPSIPYPEQSVPVSPYTLGVCLSYNFPNLEHKEIIDYLMQCGDDCSLVDTRKGVPQEYIANSEANRLELLAGLIDMGGRISEREYRLYFRTQELCYQIMFIAGTLGLKAKMKGQQLKHEGYAKNKFYALTISGSIHRIPCKVPSKKFRELQVTVRARTGKMSIEKEEQGRWYGIGVDGNERFLLADGTITHNSFCAGTFIERLTFETGTDENGEMIPHQILYTRYTMVSAEISIIPEFKEKIEMDGTETFFRCTKRDITNLSTGSRIMFRGIHTSSGNQTAKLKSIHGITTLVVDEAEEWVSEQEFDTIMLSIRKKGIQNRIIIIMNPTDSNHFIYQRYIKDTHKLVEYDGVPVQISTHPNVLHIHTSYLDNMEHCGEEFLREVQEMKVKNPEKYAHVVMGQWADVAEGAIFKKWGIVKTMPLELKKKARGLDFGFQADPSACVTCGIDYSKGTKDLYLDEEFYMQGMLIKDLISELKKQDTFVYADSADPRLIQEIANAGIIIYPVQKGAGSIIAGIEGLLDFDNIYITERSFNLQEEFRNYVWDVDKDGRYINLPVDKFNHAIDAIRYWYLCAILGRVIKTRKINKDRLGIY